jgi:hypothetical protein
MTRAEIETYLSEHPKAVSLIQAAVQEEEDRTGDPNYLGWEWHDVRAYPATLMKLVIDGLIRVNFKSNSSTCYLLTDHAATKEAITSARPARR